MELLSHPEVAQELFRMARVLGDDAVAGGEDFARPGGEVLQVSDRGGDHVERRH